ncbi:hypothetical protein ES708_27050 [subsurface metagenome]
MTRSFLRNLKFPSVISPERILEHFPVVIPVPPHHHVGSVCPKVLIAHVSNRVELAHHHAVALESVNDRLCQSLHQHRVLDTVIGDLHVMLCDILWFKQFRIQLSLGFAKIGSRRHIERRLEKRKHVIDMCRILAAPDDQALVADRTVMETIMLTLPFYT